MTKKILFIDIETAPSLGYVWSTWKTNVISYQGEGRHGYMLCFSYMWDGQKTVRSVAQTDFPEAYAADPFDDSLVVAAALALLDEAEIVIGHNIDGFDIPLIKAYGVKAGLEAPSPFRTIDTLKMARRTFRFKSNSLKNLADELGLPAKVDAGGFGTWLGCMSGDEKAWKHMVTYAKHDTRLLPLIWERMRPWAKTNLSLNADNPEACPVCGVVGQLVRRGNRETATMVYTQFRCSACQCYSRARKATKLDRPEMVA
tara:strand:+ start:6131 stop:6901 length:771 start_codon:yes stop_codon:yes gene_type:complete